MTSHLKEFLQQSWLPQLVPDKSSRPWDLPQDRMALLKVASGSRHWNGPWWFSPSVFRDLFVCVESPSWNATEPLSVLSQQDLRIPYPLERKLQFLPEIFELEISKNRRYHKVRSMEAGHPSLPRYDALIYLRRVFDAWPCRAISLARLLFKLPSRHLNQGNRSHLNNSFLFYLLSFYNGGPLHSDGDDATYCQCCPFYDFTGNSIIQWD